MSSEDVIKNLTHTLASKQFSPEQLQTIATAISNSKYPVLGVEIFPCGIKMNCDVKTSLDQFDLLELIKPWPWPINKVEIVPVGIPKNDATRLSVSFNI